WHNFEQLSKTTHLHLPVFPEDASESFFLPGATPSSSNAIPLPRRGEGFYTDGSAIAVTSQS
uniref:hypothetical protein n=1 Tax=Sphingomonas populi TaxID=2484750 RepID=UPI0019D04601